MKKLFAVLLLSFVLFGEAFGWDVNESRTYTDIVSILGGFIGRKAPFFPLVLLSGNQPAYDPVWGRTPIHDIYGYKDDNVSFEVRLNNSGIIIRADAAIKMPVGTDSRDVFGIAIDAVYSHTGISPSMPHSGAVFNMGGYFITVAYKAYVSSEIYDTVYISVYVME